MTHHRTNMQSSHTGATEETPLVERTDVPKSFSVLVEIIGCRSLPASSSSGTELLEPYCVVQYGARTIHRTKPIVPHVSRIGRAIQFFWSATGDGGDASSSSSVNRIQRQLENPVWTVQENAIFHMNVSLKDIDNKKPLVVTVWGRPSRRRKRRGSLDSSDGNNNKNNNRSGTLLEESGTMTPFSPVSSPTAENYKFIGKVRIPAESIMDCCCSEDRLELPLLDDFGRNVYNRGNSGNRGDDSTTSATERNVLRSMIALRCRMASSCDLAFAENWFRISTAQNVPPTDLFWKQSDVLENLDRPQASLVTELPNHMIDGSSLTAALAATIGPIPHGKIIVKPYADPLVLAKHNTDNKSNSKTLLQCMVPDELENQVSLASRNWIQCGSKTTKSYGRLYIEVLSASNLPNVDVGSAVGNQTDAFVSVIYGDAMCQTDIIDDELSPRWPCWAKRAFVFPINHPSHVIFVSVFGYKRHTQHRAIGRVEINTTNMQNSTLYDLKYPLLASSHSSSRTVKGTIRLRVRLEIDNERRYLFAALKQSPPMYINCHRKKSLRVARFTARGEFDNEDSFSIGVLQGYIDELLEGYLRRILYTTQDGLKSLVLWRNQVSLFGGWGFPVYSLVTFSMAVLMIEKPSLIPGMLLLLLGLLMLVNMHQRLQQPTPFRRCFGIGHFLRILIFGRSLPAFHKVDVNEGKDVIESIERALKERIADDNALIGKKEAIEKQIEELEHSSVETKSAIVPIEFLSELGKVQNLIGDICRVLRFIDTVLTWEESYLSFFLTVALIAVGVVFLFIPWGLVFKWTGRLAVVVILGPQNKVLDFLYFRNLPTEDQRIRKIFKERMLEARMMQEEKQKVRSFRHCVFGKYSTSVPSQYWTRHRDFPLLSSFARQAPADFLPRGEQIDQLPHIRGQFLCGKMILRPFDAWQRNQSESCQKVADYRSTLKQSVHETDDDGNDKQFMLSSSPSISAPSEEGFEPTELYDEEKGYVQNVLRDDSLPELGVEIFENSSKNIHFEKVFRSVHEFDDYVEDVQDEDSSVEPTNDDDGENNHDALNNKVNPNCEIPTGPSLLPNREFGDGVEIVEVFDAESEFVQRSWDMSSSSRSRIQVLGVQSSREEGPNNEQLGGFLDRNERWQTESSMFDSIQDDVSRRQSGAMSSSSSSPSPPPPDNEAYVQMASKEDLGFEVIE